MAVSKRYAHINHEKGDAQNKLDAELAYISGSLTVDGSAGAAVHQVTGSMFMRDNLVVAQQITGSDLKVGALSHLVGNAQLDAKLLVGTGAAAFSSMVAGSTLAFTPDAAVAGHLAVKDASAFASDLTVMGTSSLKLTVPQQNAQFDLGASGTAWRNLYVGTVNATALSASQVTASVGASIYDLAVTHDATIGHDLTVSATSRLAFVTGSNGAEFSHGNVKVVDGEVSASLALKTDGPVLAHGLLSVDETATIGKKLTVSSQGFEVYGDSTAHDKLDVIGDFKVNSIKFTVDAATGNAVSAADIAAQTMHVNAPGPGNKLVVEASASIKGDLTVNGDLVVFGDRVEAQVTQLLIEDGLITLMSGSTSRAASSSPGNEAGIEVEVGGDGAKPAIEFKYDLDARLDSGPASGSWQTNLNWIPQENNTWDLGVVNHKWRKLNLASDANIGGAANANSVAATAGITAGTTISASGQVSGGTLYTLGRLDAGASYLGNTSVGTLDASGLASLKNVDAVGRISASLGVTGSSFLADGDAHVGSLLVDGYAAVSGGLGVEGTISASVALEGASLSVAGDINGAAATLTSVSASGPTASSFLDANFFGTATFNGDFAVPGTGVFGALKVGGVDLSPISASVATTDELKASVLEFALANNEMIKLEVEAIADGEAAASFKYSIAARRTDAGIDAAAVEVVKEILGDASIGTRYDISVTEDGSKVKIGVDSRNATAQVFWNLQVVKKMKMDSSGNPVENRLG